MSRDRQRARRRSWPVLTVFACIVGLQLLVTVISIDLMSAMRAYVTGESLYSKGQKDAQMHLIDYAENHREDDYQRFLARAGRCRSATGSRARRCSRPSPTAPRRAPGPAARAAATRTTSRA